MSQYDSEVKALEHRDEMEALHPKIPSPAKFLFSGILKNAGLLLQSMPSGCADGQTNQAFVTIADAVRGLLAESTKDNWREYFKAFSNDVYRELESQGTKIEKMEQQVNSVRSLAIFVEGARRSQQSSSAEKAKRLGRVAAMGIIRCENDPLEKVLEFLRFAEELSETDIYVLREMENRQKNVGPEKFQDQWALNIHRVMNDFEVTLSDENKLDDQYVRSSFARLQAYGLIIQLGGTMSDTPPHKQHYALLNLGKEFLQYLRIQSGILEYSSSI